VLLGLLGGLAGLAVAYAAVRIVLTIGPANLPRADAIAIDAPVLLYTVGISIAAGLLFGLLPVARYVTPRLTASVGAGPRTVTDNRERRRARGALVVAQVALAIVLLVCSGLMIRTFQALSHVRPGFESPDDVQLAYVNVNLSDPETTTRAQQAIVDRLDAVPGVASAAFADIAPLGANNSGNDTVLIVDGRIYREGEPRPLRRFEFISPRLFTTLGTPLVAGRDFTWSDLYDHRMVAVVSETLARAEWGGPALALGKRVRASPADPWREVVGVAGDIHDDGMNQAPPPTVYFPALLASFWGAPKISFGSATMIVRTSRAGSESFLRELQQAVWSVNPDLAVSDVHTLGEAYRKSLARTSFTLTLLLLAGGMGLALGFIGIYGVIAYGVSQRTREIGIRLALGAEDGELKRMFVGHGVALAAAGVVAGAIAAGAATRVMSTLLFGVGRLDPVTYVAVILLVLLVAILASYLPARRAVRGSPVDALRTV
jgi:predicted permease